MRRTKPPTAGSGLRAMRVVRVLPVGCRGAAFRLELFAVLRLSVDTRRLTGRGWPMGHVYRKQYTMPVPKGAQIVEADGRRVARWKLRNGRFRTAEVVQAQDGSIRVHGRSSNFMARYRDGHGQIVESATGCRDEVAARAVLAQLERCAELVRAGVLTEIECRSAEHARESSQHHLDAYERHLQAKGGDPRRVGMLRKRLERLIDECKFTRLDKLSAGPLEQWLVQKRDEDMSAATRNSYRESAVGFGNWCRRTGRLTHNPCADVPRADVKSDR